MERRRLRETDSGYRVFLYIFYLCAFIMASITAYGIYGMLDEWGRNGEYVMGEVLVTTEVPFPNFAKLSTWLFFSSIIGWYCISRIGWRRTTMEKISPWKLSLIQLMLLGFVIINLYEVLWVFTVLNAKITAGILDGVVPDIDRLFVAYPDPTRPWNLIFGTKVFLMGLIISTHALYLSTRPRKSSSGAVANSEV